MTNKYQDTNNEDDRLLDEHLDAIRTLQYPEEVDVVDSVMERVASLPQLVAIRPDGAQHHTAATRPTGTMHPAGSQRPARTLRLKLASGLAAACFIGVVVTLFFPARGKVVASTTEQHDLTTRLYDVYNHCYNTDNSDYQEAAYLDNPFADIIY